MTTSHDPTTHTLHDRGSAPADKKAVERVKAFQAFQEAALKVEQCAERARNAKSTFRNAECDLQNAVNAMHKSEDELKKHLEPAATDDVLKSAVYSSERESKKRGPGVAV